MNIDFFKCRKETNENELFSWWVSATMWPRNTTTL
uniref:Uncharacterized protein n=1 Tax=Anguilla anguilla TaxID=7936 RepID=A0A0E9XY99_ANGAN